MLNGKTMVILNPTTVAMSPIMTPIPNPTLENTQFKPVQKPSTQELTPFQTDSMKTTIPAIKPIATIAPQSPPIRPTIKPIITEYPLVGLIF